MVWKMAVFCTFPSKSGVKFNFRGFLKSPRFCSSPAHARESSEVGKDEKRMITGSPEKKLTEVEERKRGSQYSWESIFSNIARMKQLLGEGGSEAAAASNVYMRSSEHHTSQSSINDRITEPSNQSQLPEAKPALRVLTRSPDHVATEEISGVAAEGTDNDLEEIKLRNTESIVEPPELLRKEEKTGTSAVPIAALLNSSDNLKGNAKSKDEPLEAKKVSQSDGKIEAREVGELNVCLNSLGGNDSDNLRMVRNQVEKATLIKELKSDQKQTVEDDSLFSIDLEPVKDPSGKSPVEDADLLKFRAVQKQFGQAVRETAWHSRKLESHDESLSCLNNKGSYRNLKEVLAGISKDFDFAGHGDYQTDLKTSGVVKKLKADLWKNRGDCHNFNDKSEKSHYGKHNTEPRGKSNDKTKNSFKGVVGINGSSKDIKQIDEGDDDDLRVFLSSVMQLPKGEIRNGEKSSPLSTYNNFKSNQKPNNCGSSESKSIKKSHASKEERSHVNSEPLPRLAFPASQKAQKSLNGSFGEHATLNKALVRFLLKTANTADIVKGFSNCGGILSVKEVPSPPGCGFKEAFVTFETRQGLENALSQTDGLVAGRDVVVEATSSQDTLTSISAPDLIGDPSVPVALVKDPTRTVKIVPLSSNVTSHQVKKALEFWGSGVSSIFLGSSSSIAYVEFETQCAKERALAEGSIDVSGNQLLILRIDVPRTTVIRISSPYHVADAKVRSLCESYGEVKMIRKRAAGMFDVQFKLSAWPHILNILNSLNGMEVDGKRCLAQPAPVLPPEILTILWARPEGRRHIKAVIEGLVRRLDQPLDVAELKDICSKLYTDQRTR